MVDADLLHSAGLYVARSALPAGLCARLRAEAASATLHTAGVFRGHDVLVDERVRRAKGVLLPTELRSAIEQRLAAVMPALGRHFQLELIAQQDAQLLVYGRGAFFRPHQDNSGDPTLPPEVKARLVSAVVFLGRQTRLPEPGSYCGGALTFFRLPTIAGAVRVRTEVWGEEGLLVAFPAGTLHEVRPVTHGPRYCLVTWFTGTGTGTGAAGGAGDGT